MDLWEKKSFLINAAFIGVILLGGYAFIKFALPILFPFLIGFGIAFLLKRPINLISERICCKRKIAAIAGILIFYALLFLLLFLLVSRLYTELYHLTVELPRIYEMYIQPGVRQLNSQFGWILRNVQQNGFLSEAYLSQRLSDFSGDAATFVTQQAMKIPQLILIFLISVVSSIFIATDYYDFSSFLIKLLPKRHRAGVFALKDRIVVTLKSLFKAYSILLAITFSELFVGFLLLGAPNPLLLASMIALVDLLPVIGTGTVLVPMGVISLLTGNYYFGVGVLILYGIVVVVHNILEPKLISRNTGLNPVLMLAAIYLGLRFFGVFGMIALPITLLVLAGGKKFQKANSKAD